MITKKNLSHINNLKDLKAARLSAVSEIEDAENQLEHLFTDLPMRAIGNTVGFVAAAVAKGFQGKNNEETEPAEYGNGNVESKGFKHTLQSVGQETAMFALSKLIEKLVANR